MQKIRYLFVEFEVVRTAVAALASLYGNYFAISNQHDPMKFCDTYRGML